jgi:hypothetical protein
MIQEFSPCIIHNGRSLLNSFTLLIIGFLQLKKILKFNIDKNALLPLNFKKLDL